MKKSIILFYSLFFFNTAFSQNILKNWYFGKESCLTFDLDSTKFYQQGSMNMGIFRDCATISDKNGNLLFYTDGISVWNKDHNIIKNGIGLKGAYHVIVIPHPQKQNQYYLFTLGTDNFTKSYSKNRNWETALKKVTEESMDSLKKGLSKKITNEDIKLCYSLIDMSKDAGQGEVIEKNVFIEKNVVLGFVAIRHNNKKDFWLIAHKERSQDFLIYTIDKNGFQTTPQIQKIGNAIESMDVNNPYSIRPTIHLFKTSLQGDKILITSHWSEKRILCLIDFDNKTGRLNNYKDMQPIKKMEVVHGGEFSPNGKYLYTIQIVRSNGYPSSYIVVYDIENDLNPKTYTEKKLENDFMATDLQLAPDGRIYISYNVGLFLGSIENPNEGVSANIIKQKYSKNDGLGHFYFPRCTHLIELKEPITAGKPFIREILFETNQAVLKPEYETELQDIVDFLLKNPEATIEISGHTDNEGEAGKNQKLSQDRAQSLANFLISKGIEKERIKAIGYGSSKPITDNNTPEGKAKNRRIEFLVR